MVRGFRDFFQPSTIAEEIGSLWPQNHRLCFGFSFQLTRSSFAGFLITATNPNTNHQGREPVVKKITIAPLLLCWFSADLWCQGLLCKTDVVGWHFGNDVDIGVPAGRQPFNGGWRGARRRQQGSCGKRLHNVRSSHPRLTQPAKGSNPSLLPGTVQQYAATKSTARRRMAEE